MLRQRALRAREVPAMERRDPAKERPEEHTGNREFPGYHTAGQGRTGK